MNPSRLLDFCITLTSAKGYPAPDRGKVRDVYRLKGNKLAIVVTDRISAYDHILAQSIPCKGQILNLLAAFSMRRVGDIVPTHIIDVPHPNITIAHECKPVPVEVVVRGYLAGHAWREYSKGKRVLCGQPMPENMKQYEPFPEPILTPTTKEAQGHDEDIAHEEIIRRGLLSKEQWAEITGVAKRLFQRGTDIAAERGLILADTKYEFGYLDGKLMLIDEVHTPDSSRYYYADSFRALAQEGREPVQLSKEYLRDWLRSNQFMGEAGQMMPDLPDKVRLEIFYKYKELYELITGEDFTPVITPEFDHALSEILKNYAV